MASPDSMAPREQQGSGQRHQQPQREQRPV